MIRLWTLYMDPICILYGSLYGSDIDPYMDPIWILYRSLYGSHMDPYMDPYMDYKDPI